jgi:hypothetical protein
MYENKKITGSLPFDQAGQPGDGRKIRIKA